MKGRLLLPWLSVLGPGLLVMLADMDAGSIIIASQSGAEWGYKLLPLQLLLIPILYIAQELAVRLGLVTGMGHGELIKKHYGTGLAWVAVATLVVCCVGALLTEFSGLVAVGQLFGIPPWECLSIVVFFLIAIAWTGSYNSVERCAIFLGVFEIVFVYVAWKAHPSLQAMLHDSVNIPWHDGDFLYLTAGNIGAVIMPWMIFFQQSAILDKGLTLEHLKPARFDTLIGAIITQIIMISVLVMTAATIGKTNPSTPLNTVTEISDALTPLMGAHYGRMLFSFGMIGAAMVATIVVSLTAAWGVGEILGYRRSLEDNPSEAPWFYGIYSITLILCALLIGSGLVNLVKLSVAIEVMNALLLPIVLGFLYLLAKNTLPDPYRLQGWYGKLVAFILFITSIFGFITGIWGLFK
jgi:NRAMP (natural resistance-associated macrophage protein)-like metal ion transporter